MTPTSPYLTQRQAAAVRGPALSGPQLRLLTGLMLAALAFASVQLAIGADLGIVTLVLATAAVTIIPCFAYGLNRTVGILFLMVFYQFAFGELMTKTLLGQPIDTNLFNPVLSHQIQFVGALAFAIGALIALWLIPLRANLIVPIDEPQRLRILSVLFVTIFLLSFLVQRAGANGQALAAFMRNFIFAALIVEIASTVVRTGGRHTVSAWSLVLAGSIATFSLMVNSKTGIIVAGLCFLLTPLAMGRSPSWRFFAAAVPAFLFLTAVLAPSIHLVRAERDKIAPLAILEKTVVVAAGVVTRDAPTLAQIDNMNRQQHMLRYDYYRNGYLGAETVWYDRFILVGFVDAIARRLSPEGPFMGSEFILRQTKEALPRQLSGEKSRYTSGTRITQALGLTDRDVSLFTTVPLPVELFAAAGFPFMLVVATLLMTLACVVINVAAFDLRRNVWACYLLITYGYFLTVQNYIGYIFFSIRQVPTDFVLITGAIFLAQLIASGRSGRLPQRASAARF